MGEQKRRITLAGVPVTVVPDAEAEKVEAVVCLRQSDDPGYFDDNLTGLCTDCGRTVIFRPSAPKTPPRICAPCALDRFSGGHA